MLRRAAGTALALQDAIEASCGRALRFAGRVVSAMAPRRRARPAGVATAAVTTPSAARVRLSRLISWIERAAVALAAPIRSRPVVILLWLAGALVALQATLVWRTAAAPQPDLRALNAQFDLFKLSIYVWLALLSLRLLSASPLNPFAALRRGWASTYTFVCAAPQWSLALLATYGLALLAPRAAGRLFPGAVDAQRLALALIELGAVILLAVVAHRLYRHVSGAQHWTFQPTGSRWRLGSYAVQIAIVQYVAVLVLFPFLQVFSQKVGGRLALETMTLLQVPLAAFVFLLKPAAAFAVKHPWRTSLRLAARHLWVMCVILVLLNLPADLLRILLPPLASLSPTNEFVFAGAYAAAAVIQVFVFISSEACAACLLRTAVGDARRV